MCVFHYGYINLSSEIYYDMRFHFHKNNNNDFDLCAARFLIANKISWQEDLDHDLLLMSKIPSFYLDNAYQSGVFQIVVMKRNNYIVITNTIKLKILFS